jgi:hypothetical protein
MVDILSISGTALPQLILSMVPDLWGNTYFVLQTSQFEAIFILVCKENSPFLAPWEQLQFYWLITTTQQKRGKK